MSSPVAAQPARGTLALRFYYFAYAGVLGIYLPLFPPWLEARGVVGVRLGIINAAAPAMSVLAPPALGILADAFGLRGGLLQLACGAAALTMGVLALIVLAPGPVAFGVLLSAALALAVCRAPMGFVADVIAVELAPRAGTTYGRLRLWGSLGFVVAVPVAARLVDPAVPPAFPLVMTAFLVAALGASLRLPLRVDVPARRVRRSALRLLADPELALFLVAVFLGQCAQAAYDVCFSLRLFELKIARSDPAFALAWDIGTGAEVILLACSAPLLRAFSPAALFAFALGCSSLRWGAIAAVRSASAVLLLQPLHAITWALGWVASLTHAARRYPAELGTVQGLFTASLGIGAVLGMVAWGAIFYRSGGPAVFGGAACVSAAACACAVALELRLRSSDARRNRSSIRGE